MSDPRSADVAARLLAQTEFARPVILEAGAGTGKTACLVARIVAWCLGPGWERAVQRSAMPTSEERIAADVLARVAAITFTEAAAAEMGQRVGEAFESIAAGELPVGVSDDALPEDLGARVTRASVLRGVLDQLRVQTIHAFCRRLLAEHPLEAGLHPGFVVDADASRQQEVVRQVLEDSLPMLFGESDDFFALVRAGKTAGDVETALIFLLQEGVELAALRADPLASESVAGLAARISGPLAAFVSLDSGRLAGLGKRAKSVTAAAIGLAQLLEQLDEASQSLDLLLDLASAIPAAPIAKWVKREFGKLGEAALGADVERLAELTAELQPLVDHLHRIDPGLLVAGRAVVIPLYAEVLARLRSRGVETFNALLDDARRLLRDDAMVRGLVQRSFDQLLVDEFQDTDPVQCDIVRCVALDGPKSTRPGLFLVGDPKQSIYGWRRADLAAYEDFVSEVEAAAGELARLVVNYRSTPAVLDEVSRMFRPTLLHEPGVQPEFQRLLPAEGTANSVLPGDRAPIEYWVTWDWDRESGAPVDTSAARADALEATAVAADIAELGASGVAWRDIGLLFRAGTALEAVLSELRRLDVPFAVEGDRSYFERREIIEASALLRCVLDPNDHLALVTVLRSAMVGVPDAALIPLWALELPARASALYGSDAEQREAMDQLVATAASEVPEDVPGIDRVEGWTDNLRAMLRAVGLLRESFECDPADVFVEKLRGLCLFEVTEASRYLGAYRLANLDRFFRDLHAALREGEGDSHAILRALRADVAERRASEEGRPREAIADAVQVMTIHKSKGLDFEHVYVLQLQRGRANTRSQQAELCDGSLELELFGAPTLGYHRLIAQREAVERAERVRTLYVATTRARQRLVLSGMHRECTKRFSDSSHMAVLERREGGRPDLAEEASRRDIESADAVFDYADARWVFPALRPAPKAARPRAGAVRLDPDAARIQSEHLAARREAVQATRERRFHSRMSEVGDLTEIEQRLEQKVAARVAKEAGTLVHAALERLDFAAPPEAAFERLRADLSSLVSPDLAGELQAQVMARADAVLERVAAGPLARRLHEIGPHVLARELDVFLPPRDSAGPGAADAAAGFLSGAIDLLYRDPDDGGLVVADYKTDRIADPASQLEKVERYGAQGANYVEAVHKALQLEQAPRFELWFLDSGEII